MLRIGIDIVEIKRMKNVLRADDGAFLNRVFTKCEISNSVGFSDPVEYYCLLFAFKECFVKAKGVGFSSLAKPKYIEVKFAREKKATNPALGKINIYFKNRKAHLIKAEYLKFKGNIACGIIVNF